jgi:hypothetical protein
MENSIFIFAHEISFEISSKGLKGKSDGFKNSKKPQKVRNGKYEG